MAQPPDAEAMLKAAVQEHLRAYFPAAAQQVLQHDIASGTPIFINDVKVNTEAVNASLAETECPIYHDESSAKQIDLMLNRETGRYHIRADEVNVKVTVNFGQLMKLMATMAAEAITGPSEEEVNHDQLQRQGSKE